MFEQLRQLRMKGSPEVFPCLPQSSPSYFPVLIIALTKAAAVPTP
jgi:hypothetical protein